MDKPLKAAAKPCGSCPYRRDVPSGVWAQHEYDKLLIYDAPVIDQILAHAGAFMCHQRDGNLCAGWLACHRDDLGTLRLAAFGHGENYDTSVFTYATDVPVFGSAAEAREHGMRDIEEPGDPANRMIAGLVRKRRRAR